MGDDSLILREDGYIRMNFPVTSLTYHSNLNIILVKTDIGGLHVLDVNSGVILQSFCLDEDEGDTLGVEYATGSDRVFVWNDAGIGARTDYNGVLLLHTVLQRPLPSSQPDKPLRIELVLSEAVLLYQCLQSLDQSLDTHSIEGLIEFIAELKNAIDTVPVRKGVKAQKWSTVIIRLPQSILRSVTTGVVQELKGQSRRIPALAIASAVGHRANELVPCLRDEESRALMYSEAERKETFKRWPHMDYKWALPARMAQAGFYHQPSPSGDDRAMCFTCMVCLVCWEKSDEPWVEHERHSPNCLFVRGEYTHNVPISVTNATAAAVPCLGVTIVSKGNTGEFIATGTADGKVNIWRFDCGLKLAKFIHLSPYDSIFSGILATDSNKVWSASLEKDSSTYSIELTAMSFVGLHSQQEQYPQTQTSENIEKDTISSKSKSALICAVTVTRTSTPTQPTPISEDSNKALFDFGEDKSDTIVQTMNDQNEAKNNLASSNKMLFLLTYDIHSSLAGSITTVVHTSNSSGNSKPGGSKKCCTVARTDDANIYDESYFQYSDDDTELPQCTNNIIDEQMSNVINLNASSSKEDSKSGWDSKNLFTKQFKVLPLPPTALLPELPESGQGSMLDNIGKISQLKSWKSGHLDSGTKLADQTDSAMSHANPITHYLNMNGPLEISNLKWIEGGDGTEKIKVTSFNGKSGTQTTITNSNNDGFDSDPPQEEVISQGIAIQCLSIPANLDLGNDSKVTHILPTEDKEHLLVVISTIDPETIKNMNTEKEVDTKMDIDEIINTEKRVQMDNKAYLLLFKISSKTSVCTIEDIPVSVKELLYHESPVDLCLLPADKQEQFSVAVVGVDGSLRLYSLPDFKVTSEKQVPKGQFTSVVYCASVERLSVSTKHGMIYFYALNNGEKDSTGDLDEDDFANLDFDMLQKAPRDEVCGPTPAPIIVANKTELDMSDLETLMSLTGSYGTNTTVPYSAVVPGFWCELSPAQRSRSDNQNNKTWRLQNTSSTWDEHVLEITLPYSVPLAHIEFGFTLQIPTSTNLPVIQVTLLKQNLHGIGYKKDATFGQRSDSPVYYPVDSEMSSNMDNPVNTEEYLQAHNAEILAGPLLLSSGLDLTQQSGTLILTSPRLYRARGRTFLIHIKTSFDPAKDMNKGPSKSGESSSSNSSKKSGFIGCDWLHQISLTVRSSQYTDVPMERQQRIAMLESNTFLNTLCEVSVSKSNLEKRKLALDLLMWVLSVRLQRLRAEQAGMKESLGAIESQQIECVNIIEKYTDALIRHCILCANRSVAKKCVKILLITGEGVKQLPRPWKSTFEHTIKAAVAECISLVGACESPGALRWLIALAQHTGGARELVARGLDLLETCAKCLTPRSSPYQRVLANRFGLYGLPFESNIFATEPPELGRGSSVPLTYASVLAGDTAVPPAPKQDHQLKELLNLNDAETDSKTPISPNAWWTQNNGVGVFGAGLSEAMALHVSCHVASDGTKLELSGAGQRPPVVNALPTHAQQLWTVVKEGQMKQTSQDPDSLQDVESSLMDCDPQEKLEFSEEKFFKEQEQCSISWATLVSRPPQHTLVVDRMHSGARRYIVLDLGHTVRLTDVIIPSCSDLVTLCIDIWVTSEETDSVKLAYATDIATKHLVLTDMQPKPLCRYMKITTIGRYGMSAMKCKISLGWFYGEIADLKSVSASQRALIALREDLSCRFKLSTGKLIELLNPYLDLYNANAAHMMAYLNLNNESDPKVLATYQECIELQQEMHTCNNILRRLENKPDSNEKALDMIMKGELSPEHLLERASTDKLRVISENIVDMLLYFLFQVPDVQHEEVSLEWCETVTPLLWQWSVVGATALATLLARLCGGAVWWGPHIADTLHAAADALHPPPYPLDRVLVLVMYMSRKSVFSHTSPDTGVTHALTTRVVQLLQKRKEKPALLAAMLTALSCVLDAVVASMPNKNSASSNRWEWVRGGRSTVPTPDSESRAARRKLHKKLFQHMHELDAARRQLDDLQRTRTENKNRAVGGLVSGALAAGAAQALCAHVLCARCERHALLLCAKVIGRLCAVTGSALLDPPSILGIAKLCVGVEPWPRHALTSLLQDIVENETSESQPESPTTSSGSDSLTAPRSSRRKTATLWPPPSGKAPRMWNYKAPCVADMLADSFGLPKNTDMSKVSKLLSPSSPKIISSSELEKPLGLESDDSDNEDKAEQHGWIMAAVKTKETKSKTPSAEENTTVSSSNISWCIDARLASGPAAAGEVLARRVLAAGATALPAAVTAPPPPPRLPPPPPPPPPTAPVHVTLQDVFTHLALELPNQTDCNYLENMVSLWLTLSGSVSGTGSTPGVDAPRIRVAPDTVTAILHSLCTLENINLRCWVLSMQAIAQMAILSIQSESGTHTIGRLILESEYFVPTIVKFVTMNINGDTGVTPFEPYLGGATGPGNRACSVLQLVLGRVFGARVAAVAAAALRCVEAACARAAPVSELHAALLRCAAPLAPALRLTPALLAAVRRTFTHAASQCSHWVRESSGRSAGEAARARRSAPAQLLHYCRRLLQVSLPPSTEDSQTDESKAQHSAADATNIEDEKKQMAGKSPCVADHIIQQADIMEKLYKALSLCDGLNASTVNSSGLISDASDNFVLKDEVFCLLAYMAEVATDPSQMLPTLMDLLRRDCIQMSQALQQLTVQLLDKPEVLAAWISMGGVQLCVDKLLQCQQSGPSPNQGLVASLMNYLKTPQIINLSTSGNKKSQPAVVEPTDGLINIAPLCTVSCNNPSAQSADVLLGGGGGACAARRVRAAAWTYHFFGCDDDAALALTLKLPYAARLHELQLQPHLTSLATCPGAVEIEAGCGGTVAPLGPPQNTAGATQIRLVAARAPVVTTVLVRLYRPRDSANMGLLQLRLLVHATGATDRRQAHWTPVMAASSRSPVGAMRLANALYADCSRTLSACVAAGGAHASRALLSAAAAHAPLRKPLVRTLLTAPPAFQMPTNKHAVGSTDPVCSLLKQLCTRCPTDSVDAFIEWLATARAEPSTQHLNTLAEVLWSLKEEHLLDHLLLESLITEELFEFVYKWTGEVTDNSLVKKALDSILCSMCFIRPHLYRRLLHHMNIPVDTDATMECLTDDTKVHGLSAGAASSGPGWVWQVAPAQLVTAAAAAASPHAARMLLASSLPTAAAAALAEFGQAKYDEIKAYNMSCEDELMTDTIRDPKIDTESEIASLEQAVALVKFIGMVCRCRAGQLWGGTACWRSLLLALCAVRPPHRSWQEERIWSDLEESTIRMLMEATTCNPPQQRILATTLHSVLLETPAPEAAGLTGFSRSLLLRLVVASERVMVEVTWSHLSGGTRRMMAPLHAACGQVLRECTPPVPLMEDTPKPFSMPSSSGGSVLRSASDTAIMTVAEAWELSLAAASASKDKRVKDVKNTSLKHHNTKKRHSKQTNDASLLTVTDELLETAVRVQVPGLEGFIPPSTTLAQLCAAVPHTFGPRLTLILHLNTNGEAHGGPSWEGGGSSNATAGGASNTLREFGACGGLALVAARLPRPHAPPPAAPVTAPPPDADWVKLDDAYEEVVEGGATSGGSSGEEGGCVGVPGHALVALRLLLKLAGYAAALLDAGPRAVQLLRLLLGAARDDDGRNISVCGSGGSLGTLPFRVVARLLEAAEVDGAALRRQLLQRGAVSLLLHSLALLTRHQHHQNSNNAGGVSVEEKGQLYWAKGTGFGTGSTQQSWNVEQALVRQRTEEEHVTVLLQVLASYINPGEKWPPEEGAVMPPEPEGDKEGGDEEPHDMPSEFIELIANSCLVPAICSYLRNDSVLDMSRHIPLYVQAVRCARALHALRSARLRTLLRPLPALLRCMARTTAAYAAKLRMSKKTIFGKMTYSQRFSSSSNSELSEEDEGLASLIADIQATSALLWRVDGEPESLGAGRALGGASREQRYMQLMRQVQFETFEMIAECPEGGWRFTVPYHFESCVRAAGERAAPARMKRLAQEAATLATSLPLSYSSSVFVRTDADRLDVMKVLIIGPSDTPYANGCFILDVYFPAEYPAVPMLINLETTGRRSVRFNPNLYNDGKVCLSVLNTWHGRPEEKWNAHTSSFLQVLVSIQSLILVPEPYFNEPGYEQSRGTRVGSCASLEYNSNIYQATVRWAMLDHLRAPPPPFQQVIQTHFWMKRNEIMQTVANWITELENQTGDERTQRSIQLNLTALKRHYVKLQEELGKLPVPPGCEDLDEPFQLPAAPAAAPPAPPPLASPPDHDHDMEKIVSHVLD